MQVKATRLNFVNTIVASTAILYEDNFFGTPDYFVKASTAPITITLPPPVVGDAISITRLDATAQVITLNKFPGSTLSNNANSVVLAPGEKIVCHTTKRNFVQLYKTAVTIL